MEKKPYRTGLVYAVGGHEYWHTGATYWLSPTEDGDEQLDLRDMRGFTDVEAEFKRYSHLVHSDRHRIAAQKNPKLRETLAYLKDVHEELWWEAVADFLDGHHKHLELVARAKEALTYAGIADELIPSLLKTDTVPRRYERLYARDEERCDEHDWWFAPGHDATANAPEPHEPQQETDGDKKK